MTINRTDIIDEIRTAIDDVEPTATDSFSSDTDDELWQATIHAVQALLEELPVSLLKPSTKVSSPAQTSQTDPLEVSLESDFVRFVNVEVDGWKGAVSELMEPDSDEARRQRSEWGRGTASKPRAMISHDSSGNLKLYCWPGGTLVTLNYIPSATVSTASITCAIREQAWRLVIYRAASIFFEGKKEPETAEKFRNMSIIA